MPHHRPSRRSGHGYTENMEKVHGNYNRRQEDYSGADEMADNAWSPEAYYSPKGHGGLHFRDAIPKRSSSRHSWYGDEGYDNEGYPPSEDYPNDRYQYDHRANGYLQFQDQGEYPSEEKIIPPPPDGKRGGHGVKIACVIVVALILAAVIIAVVLAVHLTKKDDVHELRLTVTLVDVNKTIAQEEKFRALVCEKIEEFFNDNKEFNGYFKSCEVVRVRSGSLILDINLEVFVHPLLAQEEFAKLVADALFSYLTKELDTGEVRIEWPDIDFCSPNPCDKFCEEIPTHKYYTCSCSAGFNLLTDEHTCEDIDECVEERLCSCDPGEFSDCSVTCANTPGSFQCVCMTGYYLSDPLVCTETNECDATEPVCTCEDGADTCQATCINSDGSYFCTCSEGYKRDGTRTVCIDIDECETTSACECEDSDSCDVSCTNTMGSYSCSCSEGFYLKNPHMCADEDECSGSSSPCECGSGLTTCRATCNNSPGTFSCQCNDGFILTENGTTCIDEDECYENYPCTCEPGLASCITSCENNLGSFQCLCNKGYILDTDKVTCIDINECDSSVAMCSCSLHLPSQCTPSCINLQGSHRCTCSSGYYTPLYDINTCYDRNECVHKDSRTLECVCGLSDGIQECDQATCHNTHGGHECVCAEGYLLMDDGTTCIDVNECSQNNSCQCDPSTTASDCQALCYDTEGSYHCGCSDGYTLIPDDNVMCTDINECETDPCSCDVSAAGCNVTCNNTYGSFDCECSVGFEHSNDTTVCVDENECKKRPCLCEAGITDCGDVGICSNSNGSYSCGCSDGYQLLQDLHTCADIDECDPTPICQCSTNTTGCNVTCANSLGGYTCHCADGYTLMQNNDHMCEDINECVTGEAECACAPALMPLGCTPRCANTDGGYNCSCSEGFTLSNDTFTCIDLNECKMYAGGCECATSLENTTCVSHCHNSEGDHTCSCSAGFILDTDNTTCIDVNECDVSPCRCEAGLTSCTQPTCANSLGGFTCICPAGFTTDTDGVTCVDIDECDDMTTCVCDQALVDCVASCSNLEGGHQCGCSSGYSWDNSTLKCEDTNECADAISPCECVLDGSGCQANCTNMLGSFNCSCSDGYTINESNTCEDINECDQSPCGCDTGLEVAGCQATCTNSQGSYDCSCSEGFILNQDNICIDINECNELPCQCDGASGQNGCSSTCTNLNGTFTCSCSEGFKLDADNQTCTDLNECSLGACQCEDALVGTSCEASCKNTVGAYDCSCSGGYVMVDDICYDIDECEIVSDLCSCLDTLPPAAGCDVTCQNNNGSFECICSHWFHLPNNSSRVCEDRDECTTGDCRCDELAAAEGCNITYCHNLIPGVDCRCSEGFFMFTDNMTCLTTTSMTGTLKLENQNNKPEKYDAIEQQMCTKIESAVLSTSVDVHYQDCGIEFGHGGAINYPVGLLTLTFTHKMDFQGPKIFAIAGLAIEGILKKSEKIAWDDDNYCNPTPQQCVAGCNRLPWDFRCECGDFYKADKTGRNCLDIDECKEEGKCYCDEPTLEHNCTTTCVNTAGNYYCECFENGAQTNKFIQNVDRFCTDSDECVTQNPCHCTPGLEEIGCMAECQNTVGSYYCVCRANVNVELTFLLSEDEHTCIRLLYINGEVHFQSASSPTTASVQEEVQSALLHSFFGKQVHSHYVENTGRISLDSHIKDPTQKSIARLALIFKQPPNQKDTDFYSQVQQIVEDNFMVGINTNVIQKVISFSWNSGEDGVTF